MKRVFSRKTFAVFAVILLASCVLSAQEQRIQQTEQRVGAQPERRRSVEPPAKKLSAEERENVMQMLESSEGQARGIEDPGSRAYALLQLARSYQAANRKKSLALLEDALTSARSMETGDSRPRGTAKRTLQEQILNTMVPITAERVDELLSEVDLDVRERVLIALLSYYEKNNELDRAIDMIYRIGQEQEIPYAAVNRVMARMKPEQSAEIQQLFTNALSSFRDHEHTGMSRIGPGDFGALVTSYYKQLPPVLVQQAIDVLLSNAKKQDEKGEDKSKISIASAKGAAQLNSQYEYRLFQLLPIIREFDERQAEKLLKDQQNLQTLLDRYPQGLGGVAPETSRPDSGERRREAGGGTSFMVSSGGPGPGGPGPGGPGRGGPGGPGAGRPMPSPVEMQRASKIVADADEHPQDALANASALSDPRQKTSALLGIARATLKKNSSVARAALGKALDAMAPLQPDDQIMQLRDVAGMYLQLNETEDAKKVIEKGIALAEKVYKTDVNADDPNTAMKAYWPSTNGWRSMIASAVRISPPWAQGLLKEIPDDDIRTIVQIGLANSLLGVSQGNITVMSQTKSGASMMMMQEDREER